MSWTEHTPHTQQMRETAALPPSQKNPDTETQDPVETTSIPQETKAVTTVQTREIHVYTYPNRESGYPPNSGLYRDIIKNPTLYMDRADF